MLYQLSYASPQTVSGTEKCADTLPLSAYHGTEIKVSIAKHPEQTRNNLATLDNQRAAAIATTNSPRPHRYASTTEKCRSSCDRNSAA